MPTEFEFIENLRKKFALKRIGDDCAVLPKDSKTDLVITTDLLVEDVDFRLAWTTPELIGNKALSVSLSDIAAMGARPVWAMISIGIPEKLWDTDFLDMFYQEWFIVSKKFDVEIVGGDISKTPDRVVVDSIVAGEVAKGEAILRSGARPGDLIFVTGELGGAASGLKLLEGGVRLESAKSWQKTLIYKQLNPTPQVKTGIQFGESQMPSAMIDLSDGLSSDLAHICRESRVGARVFVDKVPIHKKINSLTKSRDEKLDLALNGGEDFELLFTVDPKKIFVLEKEHQNFPFHHIGEITANAEIIELISTGKTAILEPKGYRHF
jgi:thiamine-monophosphate kinase